MKRKIFLAFISFVFVICFGFSSYILFGSKQNNLTVTSLNGGSIYNNYTVVNELETKNTTVSQVGAPNTTGYVNAAQSIKDKSTAYATQVLEDKYAIRDDYVLYSQNQNNTGLCWDYASQTAFATTVMKDTKTYVDYSEAWVTLSARYLQEQGVNWGRLIKDANGNDINYTVGDGGHFYLYNYLISQVGVVLESDLPNSEIYYLENSNCDDYYNAFKNVADTSIYHNYEAVSFDNYTTLNSRPALESGNTAKQNILNSIKYHIKNYGSLKVAMNWTKTYLDDNSPLNSETVPKYDYKYPSLSQILGGHAISIIGWDDTFTKVYNSKTYTGAWICQNSYGEITNKNSILYIFYDDTNINGEMFGYQPKENTQALSFDVNITTGNNYYTNLKGAYYGTYIGAEGLTGQKNVYYNGNVNLKYNYSISSNANIEKISIYLYDTDVTSKFTIANDDDNINISANNLTTGAYKVEIKYSNTSVQKIYNSVFYVMDGNELSELIVSEDTYTIANQYYISDSTYNKDLTNIEVYSKNSKNNFHLFIIKSAYSAIEKVELGNTNLTSNFENNLCGVEFTISTNGTRILKLTSVTGKVKTININFSLGNAGNNKTARVYYNLNGGENNPQNKNFILVNQSNGTTIKSPTKPGFNFAGWYYDKDCTNSLATNSSGFVVENSKVFYLSDTPQNFYAKRSPDFYANNYKNIGHIFLYAKWQLIDVTTTINADDLTVKLYDTIKIEANYDHNLKNSFNLTSVKWYMSANSSAFKLIKQDTSLKFECIAAVNGTLEFYAEINTNFGDEVFNFKTQTINITVNGQVPTISYKDGYFNSNSLESLENIVKYKIRLCKIENQTEIQIGNVMERTDLSFSIFDIVIEEGTYLIKVTPVIEHNSEVLDLNTIISENVDVYKIDYVTYDANINLQPKFVDAYQNIINPNSENSLNLVRNGYKFLGWKYEDGTDFIEQSKVNKSITLYANWELSQIKNIYDLPVIENVYTGNAFKISLSPNHDSGLNSYSYVWYYKQNLEDDGEIIDGQTTNQLEIYNVNQSGYYYADVTLTDLNNLSVTNQTNVIPVSILKSDLIINTNNVVTNYTYNAEYQSVNSGAILFNSNNQEVKDLELVYSLEGLNSHQFINVPAPLIPDHDPFYKLNISCEGNENYNAVSSQVRIYVKKAVSSINIAKKYQYFNYIGKPIIPEYDLGNDEQFISTSRECINVGEYEVEVFANESKNYMASKDTIKIIIRPAEILVKIDDKSSILFFKEKELTYSIEGTIYNNDVLNISFSSNIDVNKLGSYVISAFGDNINYKIIPVEGKYTVTAWPYYVIICVTFLVSYLVYNYIIKRRYVYEFDTNGGSIVSPIDVKHRKNISITEPVKDGYKFAGWFVDVELKDPFRNNFKKSPGIILYAKWEKDSPKAKVVKEFDKAILESQISKIVKDKEEKSKKEKVIPKKVEKENELKIPKKANQTTEKDNAEKVKSEKYLSKKALPKIKIDK